MLSYVRWDGYTTQPSVCRIANYIHIFHTPSLSLYTPNLPSLSPSLFLPPLSSSLLSLPHPPLFLAHTARKSSIFYYKIIRPVSVFLCQYLCFILRMNEPFSASERVLFRESGVELGLGSRWWWGCGCGCLGVCMYVWFVPLRYWWKGLRW